MRSAEADLDSLRNWWDGLREIEQFNAYVAEKTNADSLASTVGLGVEEAIARCQRMLAASEAAADREITRLRAVQAELTLAAAFDRDALDDIVAAASDALAALVDPLGARYPRSIAVDALRAAVQVGQRRSSQKPASSHGE